MIYSFFFLGFNIRNNKMTSKKEIIEMYFFPFFFSCVRYVAERNFKLDCALSFYHKIGMIFKPIVRWVHLYNRSFCCCVREMANTDDDYNEINHTV